jgi:hypothetical protein
VWSTKAQPETDTMPAGGYDGTWHKWWLTRGEARSFIMVKIGSHAELRPESMTPRSLAAVDTLGRSEIERHLSAEVPPRVIEIRTLGDPVVTARAQPNGG